MATLLLIIIYLAFISLGLPDSLLGTAWPAAYTDFGVALSTAGIISFTISGGTIVSSYFSTRVIKKIGTGRTAALSTLLTAVSLFGISFTKSFPLMIVFAIPLGLGAGSIDAALNNFVALHYKARHMSWLHCFWGIGAAAGPVIMSGCLAGSGWRSGYGIIGLIQISLVLVLFISLPLWKRFKSVASESEGVMLLSTREMLRIPGAKAALLAFFCYCAIETTTGLWGSSFLVLDRGITAEVAAAWISLYYFGITFGRFVSGFLTMKITNKNLIRTGQALIALGVTMLFVPKTDFTMWIGFFIIGLGCAPIYPSLLHDTPDTFGRDASQSIMGIQMACAYVGSTLMPPVFGFIGQHIGMMMLPVFLMILIVVMIFSVEILNRTLKK